MHFESLSGSFPPYATDQGLLASKEGSRVSIQRGGDCLGSLTLVGLGVAAIVAVAADAAQVAACKALAVKLQTLGFLAVARLVFRFAPRARGSP